MSRPTFVKWFWQMISEKTFADWHTNICRFFVLEPSKIKIYNFPKRYVFKEYGSSAKLWFIDTDIPLYKTCTKDLNEGI